ncbi:MAG: RecX family transcriptional regulator [Clostridia bacterium]|nr:RecX family transcriptional regulator [Clostridia bacterium]
MSEITAITPQIKDKRRCNVYLDGRFCCGLTLEAAMKHRLKVGMLVSEERLSEIQIESEKQTALDKALNFISATQKTEKEIRQYLSGKGYLSAVQESVVEKMKEYGFIDDGAYAKTFAENSIKRKGKRLIQMELKRKGISEKEIDEATEELCGEEETAQRLAEKYLKNKPKDLTGKQKAYRYLLSKGFDFDTAKTAVDTVCGDEGGEEF